MKIYGMKFNHIKFYYFYRGMKINGMNFTWDETATKVESFMLRLKHLIAKTKHFY
jgi:hypothetical protein